MCGIAGWLGRVPEGEMRGEQMARALRHRGPDGYGIQKWPSATLVHTRLSVIDLSTAGIQPLANEDETIWAVFNGEIYNHHEIRKNLQNKGHIFKGRCDSEILPHLYEEEGIDFVTKLRGMFAIAIYDVRKGSLILARDRFGIKPLFYAPSIDSFVFASEINALLTIPGIDARPNRQAIYDFTALFYIPAPDTVFQGIRALDAGEVLEARLQPDGISWQARRYHSWSIVPNLQMTLKEAANQVDAMLDSAVRRQMESDVPLGSLLSGGIDSSLVSVAAQRALGGSLQTFNVRFADKSYDETWAAVAVAEHIGSDHKTLDMDDFRGTWDRVVGLLIHAGQPFADVSLFAVHAVSQLMRRHVTVALSGDGGDEAFSGYEAYSRIGVMSKLQRVPASIWSLGAVVSAPFARMGLAPGRLRDRFNSLAKRDEVTLVQDLFSWIHEKELSELCVEDQSNLPIRRFFEPRWEYLSVDKSSPTDRMFANAIEANVRLTLTNDFLFKVDLASMREGLEVRVPMLDEELFSLGLSLSHRLKVKGSECKRVLRDIAKRKLPHMVAQKPKWGFGVPIHKWLDADFKMHVRDALLSSTTRLPEFYKPESYKPMVEAFSENRFYPGLSQGSLAMRVIALLAVHLFTTPR